MIKINRIVKGSSTYWILVLFTCGYDVSSRAINMLCLGKLKTQSLRNVMSKLYKEEYIKKIRIDGISTIRPIVKKPLIDTALTLYPDALCLLQDNYERNKSRYKKRDIARTQRISECYAFFCRYGMEIRSGYKPGLIYEEKASFERGGFYSSRELRDMSMLEDNVLKAARFVGALITNERPYVVYNPGTVETEWSQKGEERSKIFVKNIVDRAMGVSTDPQAIMILRKFDLLYNLTAIEDSLRIKRVVNGQVEDKTRQYNSKSKLEEDFRPGYNSLINVYEDIYALPYSEYGLFVLGLITSPEYIHKIRRLLDPAYDPANKMFDIDCDYQDKFQASDGLQYSRYILCAFDCNIARIIRFRKSSFQLTGAFQVLCFSWQQDTLRRIFQNSHVAVIVQDIAVNELIKEER